MPERRCPMVTTHGAIPCELPLGHNSPHENNENGKLTWESVYVADLRRKAQEIDDWVELLRDVLAINPSRGVEFPLHGKQAGR